MRNISNVVEFSDICVFAEQEKLAYYNAAIDVLKDFYPSPEENMFELYLGEVDQYTDNALAIEIMTKFISSKGVKYINIAKD